MSAEVRLAPGSGRQIGNLPLDQPPAVGFQPTVAVCPHVRVILARLSSPPWLCGAHRSASVEAPRVTKTRPEPCGPGRVRHRAEDGGYRPIITLPILWKGTSRVPMGVRTSTVPVAR